MIIKTPEIADDNSFAVVRILNAWNKSFSVFYASIADVRVLNVKLKNKHKLLNILNTFASKWDTDTSIYKINNC